MNDLDLRRYGYRPSLRWWVSSWFALVSVFVTSALLLR